MSVANSITWAYLSPVDLPALAAQREMQRRAERAAHGDHRAHSSTVGLQRAEARSLMPAAPDDVRAAGFFLGGGQDA